MAVIITLAGLGALLNPLNTWKRFLVACLAGTCATLALPPVFLTLMIIPAFSTLAILLHGAVSRKQAFLDGWWFGVGFFTSGLYWITISLFTDIDQFWWLVPLALFGLPMVLSIYIGIFGLCLFALRRHGVAMLVWFASLWMFFEMLRGFLFTGFPWNLIGYTWTSFLPVLQAASVVGVYGLGWFTVFVGAAPALLVLYPEQSNRTFKVLCVCILLGLTITGWGMWRLNANPTLYTDTTLRIVQANIEQNLKWLPNERQKNLEKHVTMSQFHSKPVDVVIWPETAYPYYIRPDNQDAEFWQAILPENTILLTGAVRVQPTSTDFKVWNSLIALDSKGQRIGVYDKNHLVPFGEYVPFRNFLPLPKITEGGTDFSTGDGQNIVDVKRIPPFAVLICYEAIFPEKAVVGSTRPTWILNVTNDAWFGTSSGPYQHLHAAQMRAVEQGLPLVRAANTGISAVIDPLGRILNQIPLHSENTLNSRLPRDLKNSTVFSWAGRYIGIILIFTILIFTEFYKKISWKNT